jgi:anti-sigma B factor antagonist
MALLERRQVPADRVSCAPLVGVDAWLVTVRGDLDFAAAKELAARVEAVLGAGAALLVFDLTESAYVDSTGVAVLARAAAELSRREGAGALVGPHPHAVRVLTITGLDRRFQLASSVTEALTSLEPKRG